MYARGDVVRCLDPFKEGVDVERPWVIVNIDTHPFKTEQYIAVTLTTTPHPETISIPDDAWLSGGLPHTSYVSPWAIHSPRHETIGSHEGRLAEAFVAQVVSATKSYF